MANGSFSWLTFAQAKIQLAQRLAVDITNDIVLWKNAELGIYIQQSLRLFNCLTNTWKVDYAVPLNTAPPVWMSLATLAGSPRLRTQTDVQAYTQLEYMLMEPPSGSTWTGTTQFTISDISQALQRRRDEMIVVSACNDVLLQNIGVTPNVSRTFLADNILDVPRVRYIPVTVAPPIPQTPPVTLYRDDTVALEFYEAPLYQQNPAQPETYSLSSEPPLSFDVYPRPSQPGKYEAVVLQSGTTLVPPGANPILLGIPDDFTWVLYWGALADLLGRESEATDRERAAYALKRYQDGLLLLLKTPWIMLGKVNGQAVTVDSLEATDRYQPEWDSQPTSFGPMIVIAGIDFFAAPVNSGVGLTVLGNAPIPNADGDFIQCSRNSWDSVLDLAQSLACFKIGGAEWKASLELEQRAIQACSAENSRLKSTGAFSDILLQRGQLQDFNQQRYNDPKDKRG